MKDHQASPFKAVLSQSRHDDTIMIGNMDEDGERRRRRRISQEQQTSTLSAVARLPTNKSKPINFEVVSFFCPSAMMLSEFVEIQIQRSRRTRMKLAGFLRIFTTGS
jgi:hypothetical protein